ncbi:MAG: hypothetical protein IBJ15_02020 [Alphaproteobacteria bacterium]|nr:hypothetical protein [Alphaproteobacteria bacterium]
MYFVAVAFVLISLAAWFDQRPGAPSGAFAGSSASIAAASPIGAPTGLAANAADQLARRHAAAVAYASANPAFVGIVTDAMLVAGNYVSAGWSNPWNATSIADATSVATWYPAPPAGLTNAHIVDLLAAQAGRGRALSVGRVTLAGFTPVGATSSSAMPAGAGAAIGTAALRSRIR